MAPPKSNVSRALLAPPEAARQSSHAALTHETEELMVGTMQDLRIDTVEKNAELAAALEAVGARRDAALSRLQREVVPARIAALAAQRSGLEVALRELESALFSRISNVFEAHNASLVEPAARMDNLAHRERDCYAREVPQLFEAQCGAAVRTLKGEQEALQLDNATAATREAKISSRIEAQHEWSSRRCASEHEDRVRQWSGLDGAFRESFTRVALAAEACEARVARELGEAAAALADEAATRAAADEAMARDTQHALARIKSIAATVYGLEVE